MTRQRILGLDLGTTSVGFALIDYDAQRHRGEIIRMGVRIFPDTRDAKTQVPLNQHRRAKRMVRRQTRRRRERRRLLNEFLSSQGFLPKYGSPNWDDVMQMDPYELRSKGLHGKLAPYEFGRAIYHLAKRRHFIGRDVDVDGFNSDVEDGDDTSQDRQRVLSELANSGQTLGQWLAKRDVHERKRNVKASREAVKDEFKRLIEQQAKFHATSEMNFNGFADQLHNIIFEQKPVFWRKNTLGKCPFIPEGDLCPRGSWLANQKRMLEMLNNVEIVGNQQPLDSEERNAILEVLQSKEKLTWSGVRKALASLYQKRNEEGFEKTIRFNLEEGKTSYLIGNRVEAGLKKIFGDSWETLPSKQLIRDSIHEELWGCDYQNINDQRVVIRPAGIRRAKRSELASNLRSRYGVSLEQGEALSKIKLATGWEPYSIDANRAFQSMLSKGIRMGDLLNSPHYEDWRMEQFPALEIEESQEYVRLPSPKNPDEQDRLKSIRNPTVVRVHNELRKVVNNLLDAHGKPDVIRVELARDLRRSKKSRLEIQRNNKTHEKLNEEAYSYLKEYITDPSRDQIQKWILWKECHQICPYTGKHISFNALFGPNPSFEIEHIWPRSRSFDDSMANKTLCLGSANQEKGNRTPYEFLGHDETEWFHVNRRLAKARVRGQGFGMSNSKINRFLSKEIPNDFTNRQLSDTSYAAREAMESLRRLWSYEENKKQSLVQAVSGQGTARLRHLWGMNNILSNENVKTREDHRHHAIDALVVACIHPGVSTQLARYWKGIERHPNLHTVFESPWPSIRHDASRFVESIIVSHKVQRKVHGSLHEETIYRKTDSDSTDGRYTQFVTRKPLDDLTQKERNSDPSLDKAGEGIRDRAIREIVQKSQTNKSEIPRCDGPPIRRVRILKKRNPALMRKATTGYVEQGQNHHMAVFRDLGTGKTIFDVVPRFDAAYRLSKRKPIVETLKEGAAFVNSLSIGESIHIRNGERAGIWIVQQIWTDGRVVLAKHWDSSRNHVATVWRSSVNSLVQKHDFEKVSVDPIGRRRRAND